MNTDYWASLDQYTSFAKEPWGFDRPENRKEHSLLSRATFAEWPNTTCDFSIQRGLAPPGKLSISKAKVVDRSGKAQGQSSSSSPSSTSKTRTLSTTNNERARAKIKEKPTDATGATVTAVPSGGTRNSADCCVTAAYPLKSTRGVPSRHSAQTTSPKQTERSQQREGGGRKTASPWSINNIGFNKPEGEIGARRESGDDEGYVRAAFASQAADKPYIAEALHFRARYPHTLGYITALSHARGDRCRATIKHQLDR